MSYIVDSPPCFRGLEFFLGRWVDDDMGWSGGRPDERWLRYDVDVVGGAKRKGSAGGLTGLPLTFTESATCWRNVRSGGP